MMRFRLTRTTARFWVVVLFLFVAALVLLQSEPLRYVNGQVSEASEPAPPAIYPSLPADVLINDFDEVIQNRFLTEPSFGFARIAPVRPTGPGNPHFDNFRAKNEAEAAAVNALAINGWDVGIYLYGRKVRLRPDTKTAKYDIAYRQFSPIPVTPGLKKSDFPFAKRLVPEVKEAFIDFTDKDGRKQDEVRIDRANWSYVMRPVRAANQSCLQCHTDPVITERLGDGKFTVRQRKVGDPNGILVYAFRRTTRHSN